MTEDQMVPFVKLFFLRLFSSNVKNLEDNIYKQSNKRRCRVKYKKRPLCDFSTFFDLMSIILPINYVLYNNYIIPCIKKYNLSVKKVEIY